MSPLRVYTKDGLPKGSDQLVVPAAMDGWHVVGDAATGLGTALANSWAQVAGFATVGFRKFPTGVVRLRGAITGGTAGGTIFTLPLGWRPPARVEFPPAGSPPGPSPPTGMTVLADGSVIPSSSQGTTRITLDGIEFDTESVSQQVVPVGVYTPPPVVTSLPTTGLYDGMEVYYAADIANGVKWHLRYNSAGPAGLKWEVLGGTPLVAESMAQNFFNGMTPNAWGSITSDPTIVPTLSGEYNLECVATLNISVAASTMLGIQVNNVDPILGQNVAYGYPGVVSGAQNYKNQRKAQVNAGSTLRPRYQHNGASSGNMGGSAISLKVMPVRVG